VKVDYAFVAEAADSQNGLFYVTRGGADIYLLPRAFPKPLRLGAISFVLRVVGDPEDIGKTMTFACSIVDTEDQPVNFRQEVNATFEPHPIDATRANGSVLAFRFYGFPVPDFGTYRLEVSHDDQRLASVPFWVVPSEDAPPGMTGMPGGAGEPPEQPTSGYL
jgi:hypothetical protein